jgi:hypothetical protein
MGQTSHDAQGSNRCQKRKAKAAKIDRKWLRELLAPGSSLGGARLKATVQATDGSMWIAKFPSKNDEYNSGAWEKVVHVKL